MGDLPERAIAFSFAVLAILVLRPIAHTIDLVDRPGGRKAHSGHVPLTGGLGMFLGLVAGLGLAHPALSDLGPMLAIFALLVLVGMFDDHFTLSHWPRLAVHLGSGLVLVVGTRAVAWYLGNPFGFGDINLPLVVAVAFTAVLITAAINAFNMLDGMDGLAGSTALVSMGGLVMLSHLYNVRGEEGGIAGIAAGAVCGFLVFNLPLPWVAKHRCFMGDAGSTLLGALIAWLCVRTSQVTNDGGAHPVTVLWMVGLPLFELFWSVIRRVRRGLSPMAADRGHLHHLLQDAGFSVPGALALFTALNLVLVGAGIALRALDAPDSVSLALLVVAGVTMVRSVYVAERWAPLLARRLRVYTQGDTDAG